MPENSAAAQAACDDVMAAAAQIKVKIEPQAWQADYRTKGASEKGNSNSCGAGEEIEKDMSN